MEAVAHEEPDRDEGLIVAAAPEMDTLAEVAQSLGEPPLDRAVPVLKAIIHCEVAGLGLRLQLLEPLRRVRPRRGG